MGRFGFGFGAGLARHRRAIGGAPAPVIALSASSIAENATVNTVIGVLSVANGSGSYTFTETADPDGKFNVSGANLRVGAALDFETKTSHSVTIQASNGVDAPISRTFTIAVTDVDDTAPTITSSNTHSVAENHAYSATATANEAVTWAKGGTDASLVTLNTATGAWSVASQDYELRTSVVFTLTATDTAGNPSAPQTVTLTVTDEDEIPNAFVFTDVTGAALSTPYTSNTITISGLGAGVSVPWTSTFNVSQNGGAGATSGTATNGDTFAAGLTSSASNSTARNNTLTVGGVSDTYTVTTLSGVPAADFLVTNDAQWATANSNATAGQIIELQDGGTFTALTLTNATGVIVRGQTPGVPTLTKLTINGALGANVSGIKVQANSTPTGAPKLIDILGNCNGLVIDNNIVRGGNPWNSFADFDPTITDSARMGSSGAGWSATAPYVSDLWYGIGSSGSGATLASGNITITNNVITDVGCGIKWGVGSTADGKLTINGNRLGRIYTDFISFLLATNSANVTGWEICGNELFDPFSQPQDNGNPHSDSIQIAPVTTWPFPLINGLICGNILWQTPGGRGQAQRIFTNSFDVGYPWVAPVIVDNVMLSRVTSHGIDLISSDGEGAAWAYVLRNILLANPSRNTLIQNEGSTNSVTGIGPSSVSPANISVKNSANYGNPANYIALNTVEQITNFINNLLSGNITTGLGTTAAAYATWLDTDTSPEWDALTSADATLAGLTQKSAYAANRPMVPGETAAAFRSRWSVPANRPWASLPSWVGWADLSGVTVSTLQTSEWAFVHAGNSARSISITGGEYRIADDRAGTNATAWGSSSGTVAHGKYLQVRQTSSASSSTSTTLSVTIGSTVLNWAVTTASAAADPIVALDTATPDIWRVSGASTLGSDGPLGTLALTNFKMAAAPPIAEAIFTAASANSRVRVTVLTTGKIRVGLYNTSGTIFANIDTTVAVCDGNYHDILVSWDTSDVSSSSGCDVYVDGSASKTATTWPPSPTNVGYSGSITSYQFGAPASTANFEIGKVYINTVARVDLTSGTNRAKFSADQMGLNGTGPTGSAPIILLVGTAGQTGGWNDAFGINRGTGGKFAKVGSASAADVSGSPWA